LSLLRQQQRQYIVSQFLLYKNIVDCSKIFYSRVCSALFNRLSSFSSSADLQRPSDEYHEFWMFCTTRRSEEEMGRTCPHITSTLPYISCACTASWNHLWDLLAETMLTLRCYTEQWCDMLWQLLLFFCSVLEWLKRSQNCSFSSCF